MRRKFAVIVELENRKIQKVHASFIENENERKNSILKLVQNQDGVMS